MAAARDRIDDCPHEDKLEKLMGLVQSLRGEVHTLSNRQQADSSVLSQVQAGVARVTATLQGSLEEPEKGLVIRVQELEQAEAKRAESSAQNLSQVRTIAWSAIGTAVLAAMASFWHKITGQG